MTEERTQYTTGGKMTPDNAGAAMQLITENYIAQLERTIDGYNMIQARHADTITEQKRCIAELEATVQRLRDERLQEYNVPVTLLRYIVNSHPTLPVDDRIAASRWLDTVKVTP